MHHLVIKRRDHDVFYCLLTVLLFLVSVRYALQIDVPRTIFLAIIVLIAFLAEPTEILAMCICCIPLHESIDFYWAIAVCVGAYVIKFRQYIRVNRTIIPIIVLVLWELLHCFKIQFDIVRFIAEMIPFLALTFFVCADVFDIDYDFIVRALSVTAVWTGVSLLLKLVYLADFNIAVALAGVQRLGVEYEGTAVSDVQINPNTLGIICVLATTGVMQIRMAGRGQKSDISLVIMLIILGTLTASRTFLACVALMIVLLVFGRKGDVIQKGRFVVGILVALLLVVSVLSIVFPGFLESFYERFLVGDITTGRMGTMERYHKFIISNPIVLAFGIGLHNLGMRLIEIYRVTYVVPHNGIQEVIIAWGLPGLLIFVIFVLSMIIRSKQGHQRRNLLNYIPLLVILLKIQAGQILTSGYTVLALCYAYLSMCADLQPVERTLRGDNVY